MPRVAVIPGDGIGTEVTREAQKVLKATVAKHRLDISIEELDYGAERYLKDGTTLPAGEIDRFRREVDAVFVGAVGDPRIPDMRHAREILLALRFELDLYINLRPVRCLAEQLCPLRRKTARDIDFTVLRENTEGLYVHTGGIFKKGTPDEIAINEDINTRKGVERIVRAAFEYARQHGKKSVTMSDKSNALRYAHDLWQRAFAEVAAQYQDIEARHLYIDNLVMQMVRQPEQFEVIVTNNMFGDIITDLGAELQGGPGMAASANLHPGRVSLFEPVHGSAPDLAGKNVANPMAAVLAMQMMLDFLGAREAAASVTAAVEAAILAGKITPDLGGRCGTREVGDFIASNI
jgi:3-isopropylmalate dehydrogenase